MSDEELLRLDEHEELCLILTKLATMAWDADNDPDDRDWQVKRPLMTTFADAVRATFSLPVPSSPTIVGNRAAQTCAEKVAHTATPKSLRADIAVALGQCTPGAARAFLCHPALAKGANHGIDRFDRAILLTVEMAAFSPWPNGTKWEKTARRQALHDLLTFTAPLDASTIDNIDRDLRREVRRLARKALPKGKLAALALGGLAIGVLTGGLAAPFVGGAIGGAAGLSGAAATSAGLATLGGGALTAGGLGMAGGTALVAGAGGVAGAGATAGSHWVRGAGVQEVLVEAAKLNVYWKYAGHLQENRDAVQRVFIRGLQEDLSELRHALQELQGQRGQDLAAKRELRRLLQERETEIQILKDALRRIQGDDERG